MSAMSYLQKHPKTGVYWFRRAVPAPLRATVGKREIRKSLRTTDLADAKQRALEHAVEGDRLFRSVRQPQSDPIDITAVLAEATARANAWKAEQLRKDAERRLLQPPRSGEAAERESAQCQEYADMWRKVIAKGDLTMDLPIPSSILVPGLPNDLGRRIAAHALARAMPTSTRSAMSDGLPTRPGMDGLPRSRLTPKAKENPGPPSIQHLSGGRTRGGGDGGRRRAGR